ncbi:major Facilitator Superfamily transporter [Citrobacter koseri]|nr:major Facilitator Superfamily transporter [Citrobacter koseri]
MCWCCSYWVVTVNYITRNSLGILAPELKESLGITTEQYSWIVGAFQIGLHHFPAPVRLADRCDWPEDWLYGLRRDLGADVYLPRGRRSWLHLAILRFFMGASEAAATPANAKTIGEWFPKSERPVAAGWAGVGFSIGAMLAPPIIYFAHASFRLAGCIYVYRRAGAAVG